MILATELWVQADDGTQRVIRVDDSGVTVRDLRDPPDGAPPVDARLPTPDAPLESLPATERDAVLDLLDEIRDDARVFEMRGNGQQHDYAVMVASRLSNILLPPMGDA